MLQRSRPLAASNTRQRSVCQPFQPRVPTGRRACVAMAASHDAPLARVHLRVPVYGVEWGESVGLVGSDPQMGAWNMAQAVSMQWTDGHVWVCDIDLPAGGGTVEYKYFIRRQRDAGGGRKREDAEWQPGNNQQLQVPANARAVQVDDQWKTGRSGVKVTEERRPSSPQKGAAGKQQSGVVQLVAVPAPPAATPTPAPAVAAAAPPSPTPAPAVAAAPVPPHAARPSTAKVQLRLPYKAEFGEMLFVVGSDPALGAWTTAKAVTMQWHEGHVWSAELELPIGASNVEYKYFIKRQNQKKREETEWQPGSNQQLNLPSYATGIEVQDNWKTSRSELRVTAEWKEEAEQSAAADAAAVAAAEAAAAIAEYEAAAAAVAAAAAEYEAAVAAEAEAEAAAAAAAASAVAEPAPSPAAPVSSVPSPPPSRPTLEEVAAELLAAARPVAERGIPFFGTSLPTFGSPTPPAPPPTPQPASDPATATSAAAAAAAAAAASAAETSTAALAPSSDAPSSPINPRQTADDNRYPIPALYQHDKSSSSTSGRPPSTSRPGAQAGLANNILSTGTGLSFGGNGVPPAFPTSWPFFGLNLGIGGNNGSSNGNGNGPPGSHMGAMGSSEGSDGSDVFPGNSYDNADAVQVLEVHGLSNQYSSHPDCMWQQSPLLQHQDLSRLDTLSLTELRAELRRRGLPALGTREKLEERLDAAMKVSTPCSSASLDTWTLGQVRRQARMCGIPTSGGRLQLIQRLHDSGSI